MVSATEFSRLVARPVDRLHIAASMIPKRDALHAIQGFVVSPGDAAMVASVLSATGLRWDQLRVPLRYAPEARVRSRLDECIATGVITFDGDSIAYTEDGRVAAQAFFDAQAIAAQEMWSNTATSVEELVALMEPVAVAATAQGKPSSQLVDQTLSASEPTAASNLWRAVAKVRRFRADCHVEAWTDAGHTVASIVALAQDAPERIPIEEHTNELNASIWMHLPDGEQLRFMALVAGLDGAGTPT